MKAKNRLTTPRSGQTLVSLFLCWVGLALVISNPSLAQTSYYRVSGDVHFFSGQEMKNTYGQGFGLNLEVYEPLARDYQFRITTGILFATGQPLGIPDPTKEVRSSDLWLISLPVSFSIVHNLPFSSHGFQPYLGIGGGGQIGLEIIQAEVADLLFVNTTHHRSFRTSWVGQILLGLESQTTSHHAFLEIRWLQGGPSSNSDGLSGVERIDAEENLYSVVARPDGRFSGWKFCLGFRM